MKISILGCGWLGFPLAKSLVKQGYTVQGSVSREEKIALLANEGIAPFQIQLSPAITGTDVHAFLDTDVLLIAIPPRAGKFGDDYHVAQIRSVLAILQDSPIQQIVYTSSTSVYPESNAVLNEDAEVIESSPLVQVENLIKDFCEKNSKRYSILRCAGLMGYERMPAKYFAGKTLQTGQIPVNYIHQDDVVAIIESVLVNDFGSLTLNLVTPEHPSRAAVYTKNCEEMGLPLPIFEEPTSPLAFKVISGDKLLQVTGYTFKFANPLDFIYNA